MNTLGIMYNYFDSLLLLYYGFHIFKVDIQFYVIILKYLVKIINIYWK